MTNPPTISINTIFARLVSLKLKKTTTLAHNSLKANSIPSLPTLTIEMTNEKANTPKVTIKGIQSTFQR